MGFYARFVPTKGALKAYFDTVYSAINAIFGSTGTTDGTVPRADGTGGKTLQSSGVVIDDNNDVTGVRNLAATGSVSAGNAVIGGEEVSAQSGESTFAGQTGQTVAITEVVSADYHVDITPLAESGFIGEIWISARTVNAFVVKNSGSDVSSAFAWRISGAALA